MEHSFSGAEYEVLISLPGSGLSVPIDTVESISWTEQRTASPDKDHIEGEMILIRFERHPLFSVVEPLVGATTIGQLPAFDLHLQAFNDGQACGTCCVLLGVRVHMISERLSSTDLGGSIGIHFLAEGVSHWESL